MFFPCVISIEGNIGSGKSTILNILKTHFSKNPEICFLTEPVLEWQKICDSDGVDIIQKYYENQEKYNRKSVVQLSFRPPHPEKPYN